MLRQVSINGDDLDRVPGPTSESTTSTPGSLIRFLSNSDSSVTSFIRYEKSYVKIELDELSSA